MNRHFYSKEMDWERLHLNHAIYSPAIFWLLCVSKERVSISMTKSRGEVTNQVSSLSSRNTTLGTFSQRSLNAIQSRHTDEFAIIQTREITQHCTFWFCTAAFKLHDCHPPTFYLRSHSEFASFFSEKEGIKCIHWLMRCKCSELVQRNKKKGVCVKEPSMETLKYIQRPIRRANSTILTHLSSNRLVVLSNNKEIHNLQGHVVDHALNYLWGMNTLMYLHKWYYLYHLRQNTNQMNRLFNFCLKTLQM